MYYFSQVKLMNALSFKDVISVKVRPRCDSWTDQWNRLIMSKIFFITSIIIGVDYFQDEITCILPENTALDDTFVSSVCWISGFYIYPELRNRWKHVGYHGIPKDLTLDGTNDRGDLCSTKSRYGEVDDNCVALFREFFLQYQWYPFFVAALAIAFYSPYILYRIANSDLIELKNILYSEKEPKQKLLANYFDASLNTTCGKKVRIIATLLVKLLYIGVNVASFFVIDYTLSGRFINYGPEWIKWNQLNNEVGYDLRARGYPKPGNELLPSMGICEVHEASRDVRNTLLNRHKFICEISQNVLYQHCLLLVWFLLLLGAILSSIGLLSQIYIYANIMVCICCKGKDKYSYKCATLREYMYLQLIRKYGDSNLLNELLNNLTVKNRINREELEICKL